MRPHGEQTTAPAGSGQPYSAGAQAAALAGFLLASLLVAAVGGLASAANVTGWYATADKAPWSPPNGVFGPVWTILYTAMAVAAWLVWRRRTDGTRQAMVVYAIQLVLNLAWTPVFFALYPALGTTALWLGLAIILALIAAVTVTVLHFGPISRAAGLLLLPYVSWLVFAASLNWWAAAHN
ncbi:TspO/MBR family protein [Arthrobacter liuii]|uniref:TspO/MBR-related protein n=1 Tax=Arthrobacter liuii TaxID=1476996 RepID=A0ABQ2AZ10_9MICC|nr:TspO/MBR family protein [Arthrobacter liuii]GGI02411.1 putative TspO/MBR-related protein precursor [Arthrobacter liuii]